jgi:MFS family permease
MILACAVMVGIGNNLWHPTAIPWLGNRFSERRGLVMSFHGMGGNFGGLALGVCTSSRSDRL